MKKTLLAIFGIVFMFSAISCGTTEVVGSGIKGKAATVRKTRREVVAYQGDTFGREIPEWVLRVADGNYDAKAFLDVMPALKGKKIFVATGRGPSYSFVKEWTNLVEIETEVAGTMERIVGKALKASYEGTQEGDVKGAKVQEQRDMELMRQTLQSVRLTGLERVAEYWVQLEDLDKKGNAIANYYEYYTVWAIDEDLFNDQLGKAMEKIDETTTEGARLKELMLTSLESQVLGRTVEEVDEDYEEEFDY